MSQYHHFYTYTLQVITLNVILYSKLIAEVLCACGRCNLDKTKVFDCFVKSLFQLIRQYLTCSLVNNTYKYKDTTAPHLQDTETVFFF